MKILLLGANGQLGRSFLLDGGLARHGDLVAASRDGTLPDGRRGHAIDLANPEALHQALDAIRPRIIVNTAAYTQVDRAESDEALATRINGEAVGALGAWAAEHDALAVHYSTDYVFAGDAHAPYPVDAQVAPVNAYGRSKLAGETALRASGSAHLIFRTAWVYAPHGHNFLRTMLRLGAERDTLRVVADQHGAPTSTALIVAGTLAALARWSAASPADRRALQGTHHLVASGATTWHGFAEAIFEEASARGLLAHQPIVEAIPSSAFPAPARRPAWSVLDNRGFAECFDMPLASWRDALHEVMDNSLS